MVNINIFIPLKKSLIIKEKLFINIKINSRTGYKDLGGTESLYVSTYVGLHTTAVNKTSLRETYNNALISHIDKWYVDNSKTALSTMNYTDNFNQLKTTGEALCDPTAYSMNANSTLEGYVTAWSKAIDTAFDSSMYFYVPETIYIYPIASSSKYNFQYYVDRADTAARVHDTSYNKTTDNVFFSCEKASNIRITARIAPANAAAPTTANTFLSSFFFAALPISAAQAMQTAAATSAMPSVSHSQESSCRIFMRSSSPVR